MTWKLIVAYLGWLLASVALAVLLGSLAGGLFALIGLVDSLSSEQQRVVEITAVAGFVVLALTPFLLRKRLIRSEDDAPS